MSSERKHTLAARSLRVAPLPPSSSSQQAPGAVTGDGRCRLTSHLSGLPAQMLPEGLGAEVSPPPWGAQVPIPSVSWGQGVRETLC